MKVLLWIQIFREDEQNHVLYYWTKLAYLKNLIVHQLQQFEVVYPVESGLNEILHTYKVQLQRIISSKDRFKRITTQKKIKIKPPRKEDKFAIMQVYLFPKQQCTKTQQPITFSKYLPFLLLWHQVIAGLSGEMDLQCQEFSSPWSCLYHLKSVV